MELLDIIQLPIGRKEFDEFAKILIERAGLPDNDSMRWTVAVMIMHLDPSVSEVETKTFISKLKKAAANEVANAVIQELKAKQKAENEAKILAEKAASNEPKLEGV